MTADGGRDEEVGVKIVILLIICAFFVIPLLLLNNDDGMNSVILSTTPARPVIQSTDSAGRQTSSTPEKNARDESREKRHMLILAVFESLRK